MLSLSVTDPVKQFMNRIIREDILDSFLLREAVLVARTRVHVYGENEDAGGFYPWAQMKPTLAELIKLGGKPKSLKLILSADDGLCAEMHDNAKACFLNLTYEADAVTLTTAASQKTFAMDKVLDNAWDAYVQNYLNERKIGTVLR